MRLLGGWFISIKYLPVAADVEIRPVPAGTAIEVHAQDTFRFGLRVGMNERLTAALDDLVDLVINAGRSVSG